MVWAVTGSAALATHLDYYSFRCKSQELNEIDIVYGEDANPREISDRFNRYKHIDISFMPNDLISMLLEGRSGEVPSLNNLYTLKLSHVFWNIHHDKTIADIIFMSRNGAKVNKPLFYKLKEHWKTVHGGKEFLSLDRSKEEFFDDYVPKVIDHDQIHVWVAKYENSPLYERCLKDGEEVLLDWNKFSTLSHEDKIHMMREEIMTIGIERWGIPKMFDIPSGVCYSRAARLVLTNLMKGRFANFIAFNLDEILNYRMTDEYFKVKKLFYEVEGL